MRRHALPGQQTGGSQTVERQLEVRLRLAYYRSEQGMRKLATDSCPNLRYLLGRAEPVKPRH